MKLAALVALTMLAFAANSVLNRAAVNIHGMDPGAFAVIRTVSGALALLAIAGASGRLPRRTGWADMVLGAGSLALYMVGFSLAYLTLDAGIGALILFGGVQLTMFAGAVVSREPVPLRRWLGAGVALAGLVALVWPGESVRLSWLGIAAMSAAAAGWGLFSLLARKAGDPLAATARSFVLATPLVLPLLLLGQSASPLGMALAVLSGVVTSGLGYALWYHLVPQLGASRAAVAQLSVPVFAAGGGAALLAEPPTLRLAVATAIVLAGIAISMLPDGRIRRG